MADVKSELKKLSQRLSKLVEKSEEEKSIDFSRLILKCTILGAGMPIENLILDSAGCLHIKGWFEKCDKVVGYISNSRCILFQKLDPRYINALPEGCSIVVLTDTTPIKDILKNSGIIKEEELKRFLNEDGSVKIRDFVEHIFENVLKNDLRNYLVLANVLDIVICMKECVKNLKGSKKLLKGLTEVEGKIQSEIIRTAQSPSNRHDNIVFDPKQSELQAAGNPLQLSEFSATMETAETMCKNLSKLAADLKANGKDLPAKKDKNSGVPGNLTTAGQVHAKLDELDEDIEQLNKMVAEQSDVGKQATQPEPQALAQTTSESKDLLEDFKKSIKHILDIFPRNNYYTVEYPGDFKSSVLEMYEVYKKNKTESTKSMIDQFGQRFKKDKNIITLSKLLEILEDPNINKEFKLLLCKNEFFKNLNLWVLSLFEKHVSDYLSANLINSAREKPSTTFGKFISVIYKFYDEKDPKLAESMFGLLIDRFGKDKQKTQMLSEILASSDINDSFKLFLCDSEFFKNEISSDKLSEHIDGVMERILSDDEQNSIRKHIENVANYCLLLDGGKSGKNFDTLKTFISEEKEKLKKAGIKTLRLRNLIGDTFENFCLTQAGSEIDAATRATQSMSRQ